MRTKRNKQKKNHEKLTTTLLYRCIPLSVRHHLQCLIYLVLLFCYYHKKIYKKGKKKSYQREEKLSFQ